MGFLFIGFKVVPEVTEILLAIVLSYFPSLFISALFIYHMLFRFAFRLGIALILFLALYGSLFGLENIWKPTLDIQMHNTYFVLDAYLAQIGLLMLVLLVVYVADALRLRAIRNRGLLLTIGSCAALLVLVCTKLQTTAALLHTGGYTIYPPLSAFPPATPESPPGLLHRLLPLIWLAQIFFLGVTIWAGISFGKLRAQRPTT